MPKEKVVVGMSGGVDSSVAAYLLLEQGFEVIGVTMQIWQEEDGARVEENGGCCGLSAVEDARRVAQLLGIPHYVMNFREEFQKEVIDYFVREYQKGHTPNPCIACNRFVKWESLLARSMAIGADYIATGHYASVCRLGSGRYALKKSVTEQKDQTYALYSLTQRQLSRTLMPVGAYTKQEIRETARGIGLNTADKPDSQEICFIPDHDYASFIDAYTGQTARPGSFVDENGQVLGRHRGITHYTIGQRRGLGLPAGERIYVCQIRPESNEVVLGPPELLYTNSVSARQIHYMSMPDIADGTRLTAKIRYNHRGAPCTVFRTGEDALTCRFDEPVRAAAPGQALVLYDGPYVAGGGTIVRRDQGNGR